MTRHAPVRASLGLAALALLGAGAVTGCAAQRITSAPETVSTAGASAAVVDAQNTTCPDTAPQTLSSNADGLAGQMEPLAATKVLLCVYPAQAASAGSDGAVGGASGTGDTSGAGASAPTSSASPGVPASEPATSASAPTPFVLSNADQISTLRNALNALKPPPTAPVSCPEDTGAAVLGIFTAGTQEVEVLVQTAGCPLVGNGQKTGWVGETDFLGILTSVLGEPLAQNAGASSSPS